MFFSGDAAARRKVELRGRSSKESDRQVLLNKARDEREQRMRQRQRQQSALRIQRCYRGRRVVKRNQTLIRQQFCKKYGDMSDKAGRDVFKPESKYLPELLYFLAPSNTGDFLHLVGVCRHFLLCVEDAGGDVLAVVSSADYAAQRGAVNYRIKRFTTLCLRALHCQRELLKEELMFPTDVSNMKSAATLVAVIVTLARGDMPWAGSVIEHIARDKLFHMLRELLLTVQVRDTVENSEKLSALEFLLHHLSLLYIQRAEYMKQLPYSWSISAQIFSIPLLWRRVPLWKQVGAAEGLWAYVVHQSAMSLPDLKNQFPPDVDNFPSAVCFLGNILEISRLAVEQTFCNAQQAIELASLARYLMSSVPPSYHLSPVTEYHDDSGDEMAVDVELPIPELMKQLQSASNSAFIKEMVRVAFSGTTVSPADVPEASSIAAVCGFIYAAFSVFDKKTLISALAYAANLVPSLWRYINACQLNQHWPSIDLRSPDAQLTPELLGWMLPVVVFCPVFSHFLFCMDNDEFYNMQHPISIDEVAQLVLIVKEGLWQNLWVLSCKPSGFDPSEIFVFENMRQFFISVASTLLAELHDHNSKRQYAPPHIFHAREAIEESFFHQAEGEHTKARELLNKAPFLIPFTSRVRVYTTQVTSARHNFFSHFAKYHIRVQRDRIVDDAFTELNSVDDLRQMVRVSYVNELGVEEAGVDGGGIFKDFMETITREAFDLQYGLFKETADHLLYPNPASHVVHDNHLLYFEFLGRILGKAMFEGILVDIPFATFFLRKLRKKHNYLHDLPSLDPELYKNLLYLKKNTSTVAQLDIAFVIEDNEYGEQVEVELLPGGKDIQVTSENVFRYIHLVANHRLNHQIRQQSVHFLRGFQQLISPEWIDMFNEHELQILISGSQDNLDIDDLRRNTQYGGGYHENHPVIQPFWEVLKALDVNLKQKFIKFVTGCSRGPLLGFKYLEPQFCIQKTSPDDANDDRLPTSATCMNLLKLPPYTSKETIREKLIYAISAGAGFDLS